jgi:hypothetical protein
MPHVIQPAPTGRAKCRGCGEAIAQGGLRFGEVVENPFAEGNTTHWFHLDCAAYKRPEPVIETLEALLEPLEGREGLLEEARRGVAHHRLPRLSGAERATTGRAACRACKTPIAKGSWRLPLVFYEDGRFAPAGFVHAGCAAAYFETGDLLGRIKRFAPGLSADELAELLAEIQKPAS